MCILIISGRVSYLIDSRNANIFKSLKLLYVIFINVLESCKKKKRKKEITKKKMKRVLTQIKWDSTFCLLDW